MKKQKEDERKGKKWREKLVKERNVISENKNKKKQETYFNCKTERAKDLKRTKKVSKEQL